jgi:predicted solute-binding protein
MINELPGNMNIDMNKYFTQNISYLLDTEKKKALEKFLQMSQSFNAEPLLHRV